MTISEVKRTMEPCELKEKLRGIIPVQLCPYTKEYELDVEGLKENTKFLADFAESDGKDVVILTNGSTTEFYANSIEEQKTVIKLVVGASGDVPVVAGTGQAGTRETIKLTKYAEEVGADGAMVVIPYYHTPTKEGMYQHYKKVAESVKMGIMVYNNPDVSGAWISPDLLAKISKIDNVVGVKDNTPNINYTYQYTRLIDPADMTLIDGPGPITYVAKASFGLKFKGFVNMVGNFAPALVYRVYEAVKEGDFMKAYQALEKIDPFWTLVRKFMETRESTSIIPFMWRTNYMFQAAGKVAMDLVGLNGGPMRLPMTDLTEGEREEIKEALKKMSVL